MRSGRASAPASTPRSAWIASARVFLLMLGIAGGPVLVFAAGYLGSSGRDRAVGALTGLFVGVLVLLLCARDVLTFLGAWELMTLVPAAIILVWHNEERARRAVFVYVAVTHVAGAGAWVSLLVLAQHGALGGPALDASSSSGALVAIAALVGFGAKAGVMPLHVWLPRAHPLAPAHVSALMSGVMIKIALYGLMRVLVEWLGRPPLWLGVDRAGARRRVGARRHRLRALPARAQAPARAQLDRERRHRPARARRRPRAARAGRPGLGRHRVRRGAAARDQPRDLQVAAVPRRRSAREGGARAASSIASAACCGACRGPAARS